MLPDVPQIIAIFFKAFQKKKNYTDYVASSRPVDKVGHS